MGITLNKFKAGVTDTIYIHAGRFHADDALFAAMASIAISKNRKTPTIRRTNDVEFMRGENIIVGDIGRGVYDHHMEENNISLGAQNNTEDYYAAACGLLYKDISHLLFPGNVPTETRLVFEAFLDIIEHCDNTPDNSTFSDSINLMTPADTANTDERAMEAIKYCKDVVQGFMDAHMKERAGKMWAVPKTNKSVLPGMPEKYGDRYTKCPNSVAAKYKYISYNNKTDMKLRAMSTFSLAMSVLPEFKRKKWRKYIETCDKENQEAIAQREKDEWPQAVANMKHLTITIDNYIPWTKYIKDINAIFIIQESQRGGFSISPVRTNNGKYRCSPAIISNATGCTYVANDSRFLLFETKEMAQEAAYTAGKSIQTLLKNQGLEGYRKIYGGCADGYTGAVYQDIISEDIALKCYSRDYIQDENNVSIEFVNSLMEKMKDNEYMMHNIYSHFKKKDTHYEWVELVSTIEEYKNNNNSCLTDFKQ